MHRFNTLETIVRPEPEAQRFPGEGKQVGGSTTVTQATALQAPGVSNTIMVRNTIGNSEKKTSSKSYGLHQVLPGTSPTAECVNSLLLDLKVLNNNTAA